MDQPTNRVPEITPWEVLEEQDVSPSKYYPVFKQVVKMHGGRIVDGYFVSKLPDAAMVVAITPKKELIMVKQWRQGIKETTLELPAGMNDGRTPIDAARAELHEETGATATTFSPLGIIAVVPPKNSLRMYGYFCYIDEIIEEQDLDPNENIEVVKVPLLVIDKLLIAGEISCADTIAFIALARIKFPEAFLL
jgi:8-oxo-dGTP pyrophosphatase MutT (NUDIX family)